MTCGWQYELDRDAILAREPTPGPRLHEELYTCQFCKQSFKSWKQLDAHVTTEHSVRRPMLIIGDREPMRDAHFMHRIAAADVCAIHTTEIVISRDGAAPVLVERGDLGLRLADCVRSVVRVRLINAQSRNVQPVVYEYVLRISAPDPDELAAADDRFLTILGRADPTIADVDRFVTIESESAAAAYLSGLADYVRGILLKDGDPASGVTGTHHDYRNAFARALQALKDHDRPLPRRPSASFC
jgi:hypothetical protein